MMPLIEAEFRLQVVGNNFKPHNDAILGAAPISSR
jgi:hypothetical protein